MVISEHEALDGRLENQVIELHGLDLDKIEELKEKRNEIGKQKIIQQLLTESHESSATGTENPVMKQDITKWVYSYWPMSAKEDDHSALLEL